MDLHLQPFVSTIDSHIDNTGHLINILKKTKLPTNCTLATIDVSALYLNIPHNEGIQAVRNRLYTNNPNLDDIPLPTGTMTDLLNIILTRNHFQFAGKMYHQVQGTAMGTKMAPAYANIFMAELEEGLLRNYHTTPILWKRYIDDILCIWPGPPDSLKEFIRFLNRSHGTIKFTYECSETTVDFLDVTIYKGKRYHDTGILDFKPFFRKTNKFQYLEYSSYHPRNTFGGIVRGELTRLLRACSDQQGYIKIQRKMYQSFRDRNYPKILLLQRALESVSFESRPQTLEKKDKNMTHSW